MYKYMIKINYKEKAKINKINFAKKKIKGL